RYQPEDATPGGPNPLPPVEAFPMLDGLIANQPVVHLAWYPAPGATAYHLQLATEPSFALPIVDTDVVSVTFTTPSLAPGDYLGRGKPTGRTGRAARSPAPPHLTVGGGSAVAGVAASHELAVPMISQHKDTAMLLLESVTEKGPHAWDVAHPDLD